MDPGKIIEKYGVLIIAGLLVIIFGMAAYFIGYVNGRPAIPEQNVTIIYVYVTPTPTPTPYPPNVIMYGKQPIAIIGKATPAQYSNQIDPEEIPAITTNGHLTGQGYYNMTTGAFKYYYVPGNKTSYDIESAGQVNIDWNLTYNPYLVNYSRGIGNRTVGEVDLKGKYHNPTYIIENEPPPTPTPKLVTIVNVTINATAIPTPTVTPTLMPTIAATMIPSPSPKPTTNLLNLNNILIASIVIVMIVATPILYYTAKNRKKKE